MNKVFGVGLSRTGTRSLKDALNILGIKTFHWPLGKYTYREISSGNYNLTLLKKYQGITDVQIVPIFPMLDKAYPNSKFILTVRDKEGWVESMKRINTLWRKCDGQSIFYKMWVQFEKDFPKLKLKAFGRAWWRLKYNHRIEYYRKAAYGAFSFADESFFPKFYDQHIEKVKDYFKNRHQDLLVIDICEGEGWEKLCPFVGKPIPDVPFPHATDYT